MCRNERLAILLATAALGLGSPAIGSAATDLILYLGETSPVLADTCVQEVTSRTGFEPDTLLRAEALAGFAFGDVLLWPTPGAVALCGPDEDRMSLDAMIDEAEAAIHRVEYESAVAALTPMVDSLACVELPSDRSKVAHAALMLGYARFLGGDRNGAEAAFAVAAVFDPEIEWDEYYPPDAQQVFNSAVLSSLRLAPATLLFPLGAPDPTEIRIDEGIAPLDGKIRPGSHQISLPGSDGERISLALVVQPGETVQLVGVTELVSNLLDGRDDGTASSAIAAALTSRNVASAYIIDPPTGRLALFEASSARTRIIPGASTRASIGRTAPANPGPVLVIAGVAAGVAGLVVGITQRNKAMEIYGHVEADPSIREQVRAEYDAAGTAMGVGFGVACVGAATMAVGIPVWAAGARKDRVQATSYLRLQTDLPHGQGERAIRVTWYGRW